MDHKDIIVDGDNISVPYWQCGQCDGGVTMLIPSGIRWIHTFRKLPTMQPNTKKTNDQKWNGTSSQLCASEIGSMPIDV